MVVQVHDPCLCKYIVNMPKQLLVMTAVTCHAGRQPARSKGAAYVRVVSLWKEESTQLSYHNLLPWLEQQKQCVGAPAPRHRLQLGLTSE